MPQFSKREIHSLEKPHSKTQLSTRIGRAIERASYIDILLLTVLALSLAATYFTFGFQGHTLSRNGNPYDARYLEAVYFCIVTFTSLGYGDLAPVGFGRLVASVLVFWGLATIALVIGKIASERSQTSLLLLHRSDVERRLSAFAEKFAASRQKALKHAEAGGVDDLDGVVRALVDGHQAANRYIVFHANQSTALAYGNDGVLSALVNELVNVQECSVSLYKAANESGEIGLARSTRALAYRLHWTVSFLRKTYDEAATRSSWFEAFAIRCFGKQQEERRFSKTAGRAMTRMHNCLDNLEKWRSMNITVDTLDDVYKLTPNGPMEAWPKHFHKEIATKIGSSNKRVSRHLDQLIRSGKLPK